MRKTIISRESREEPRGGSNWLDLGSIASVEVSSEDPAQPIDAALQPVGAPGWRAAEPGPQMIRILFDQPQRLSRIYLLINEEQVPRTQEFVLRWSGDGKSFREIVRQQFTFSPPGTSVEQEEFRVELAGVAVLELEIMPDISGSAARASLGRLLLA